MGGKGGGKRSLGHPTERTARALGLPWKPYCPLTPATLPPPCASCWDRGELVWGKPRREMPKFFRSLKIVVISRRKEILNP